MESDHKITTRNYLDSDYKEIKGWWDSWKFTPLLKEILPDIGAVTEVDSVPMFAAWLYLTNSSLHCITWFVRRNVYMPKSVRDVGIISTFNYLEKISKSMGGRAIYTATNSKTIQKAIQTDNYIIATDESAEFIKVIR